jgi:hypothetical protein
MTFRVDCSAIAVEICGATGLGIQASLQAVHDFAKASTHHLTFLRTPTKLIQECTAETMLEQPFVECARSWFTSASPLGEIQAIPNHAMF